MNHDFAFLLGFAALAAAIPIGCRLFSTGGYSRWLAGIMGLAIGALAWLHAYTDQAAATVGLHYTIVTLAQFAVLALGFKLWFSINYPRFGRSARVAVHLAAHTGLAFVVVAGYSLKAAHPLITFLIYPLASLSVALVAESVELRLGQPGRASRPTAATRSSD